MTDLDHRSGIENQNEDPGSGDLRSSTRDPVLWIKGQEIRHQGPEMWAPEPEFQSYLSGDKGSG